MRKDEIDCRVACGTIARESTTMIDVREFLVGTDYKTTVFDRFVPNNSLLRCQPLLETSVLSNSEMSAVVQAYSEYEKRDRMAALLSGGDENPHKTARKRLWEGLHDSATAKQAEVLKPIIEKLLAHSKRPSRQFRCENLI
jgi:hypothetical protein